MLKQPDLSNLSKNDHIDQFLLLRKIETKNTKQNKPYLFLELGDSSATLNANIWDRFENYLTSLKVGEIVKVVGNIEDYQGNLQIKITSLTKTDISDNISPIDFLPKSKKDKDQMVSEFIHRIKEIQNLYLKKLLENIFDEKGLENFSLAPAGKTWHHAYLYGLIEHTLEIIKICELICDIHPEINRDLLITGAMMHDFGKTIELNYDNSFEYTDKGKLLGHIVISAMRLNEEINKIPHFPEDLRNCLIHLVLSHQGKLEFATPVVPKTLEAIALYQADELSAKVNAYKNAISKNLNSESGWTKFIPLASTELYRPNLSADNEGMNNSLFD